jgi:hypothetical protein
MALTPDQAAALLLATARATCALVERLNYLEPRQEFEDLAALMATLDGRARVPPPIRSGSHADIDDTRR